MLNNFDDYVSNIFSTRENKETTILIFDELDAKDLYAKYRDTTVGTLNTNYFEMFRYLTNIPKSKYDGVIGWIRQR